MAKGTITAPLSSSPQRWIVPVLLLFFVALSVQYSFKAMENNRSAILRWRPQILEIDQVDIYQRYTYPNPPIMPLILKPLASLPPLAGALCWFYLKVGMTLLALYWIFRLVEIPGRPFPSWAKAAAVLLSLRPIMGDLSHGNVNLFILFLVVGALYAFRHGRDLTTGLLLALAIACKVTPALFIPYFLWKRAWKTVAGCAAGLVLFLVVVPGCFLGMTRNLQLLESWYAGMVQPYVGGDEVTTDLLNQSLPGLVYRLFSHSPSSYYKGVGQGYANIASVDPHLLGLFVKGCMLLFAGLVVWTCRTPTKPRYGWRLAAEFSLIILGMLLFSERSWKHHYVTLIMPFAVLTYYLAACRPGWKLQSYLIATLVVATLLMMATGTTGVVESWDATARQALVEGPYVWANLLLLAALVVLLRQRPCEVTPLAHPSFVAAAP
jgi:hypothetical protein